VVTVAAELAPSRERIRREIRARGRQYVSIFKLALADTVVQPVTGVYASK
jgi:hypothetical protein